jgi:hypothetical protein
VIKIKRKQIEGMFWKCAREGYETEGREERRKEKENPVQSFKLMRRKVNKILVNKILRDEIEKIILIKRD